MGSKFEFKDKVAYLLMTILLSCMTFQLGRQWERTKHNKEIEEFQKIAIEKGVAEYVLTNEKISDMNDGFIKMGRYHFEWK